VGTCGGEDEQCWDTDGFVSPSSCPHAMPTGTCKTSNEKCLQTVTTANA